MLIRPAGTSLNADKSIKPVAPRNYVTSGGIEPVRTGSIEPSQGILLEQRTG